MKTDKNPWATKQRFIYLSVYSNEKLSAKLGLGFSPAGTNKKNDMLNVISSLAVVSVLSVTAGFKGVKKFGGYYAGEIDVGKKSIKIEFMPWLKFPVIAIFANQVPIIYKLCKLRLAGAKYIIIYNTTPEVFLPAFIAKIFFRFRVILQLEDGPNPNANRLRRSIEAVSFEAARRSVDGIIANSNSFGASKSGVPLMIFRGSFLNKISNTYSENTSRYKLKIVMSGSLDIVRGGALLASFLRGTTNGDILRRTEFVFSGKLTNSLTDEFLNAIAVYKSRGGTAKFRGFLDRDELEAEFKSADIFLSLQDPSHPFSRYSFPSKIMEYSSFGKPIVSTAVSDLKHVDLFQGLVFVEYDERSLEAAILSVIARYAEFSLRAREMSRAVEVESSFVANQTKFSQLIANLEPR